MQVGSIFTGIPKSHVELTGSTQRSILEQCECLQSRVDESNDCFVNLSDGVPGLTEHKETVNFEVVPGSTLHIQTPLSSRPPMRER